MALGDFLVFLTRIASVPKFRQKMAVTKWTLSLLKMVGHNGESIFFAKFSFIYMDKLYVCSKCMLYGLCV